MRYWGPARIRFSGDPAVARRYISEARKYLGQAGELRTLGRVPSTERHIVNSDGVLFRVQWIMNQPIMTIDVRGVKDKFVERVLLFVAGGNDDVVSVVDPFGMRTIKHIDCGTGSFPFHCTASPNGTAVFVSCNSTDEIKVISTASLTIAYTITMPPGFVPFKSVCSPDGLTLYVTGSGSGTTAAIDLTDNSLLQSAVFGTNPFGIAITPDGEKLYAGRSENVMESPWWQAFNPVDMSLATAIDMNAFTLPGDADPTNNAPGEMTITRDGATMVCAVQNNFVVFIDTGTDTILGACTQTFGFMDGTIYVCLDAFDDDLAYVASRSSCAVSAIRISTREQTGVVQMGTSDVRGMAANPLTGELYTGRFDDGQIQIVRPGILPQQADTIELDIPGDDPGMTHEMWHIGVAWIRTRV